MTSPPPLRIALYADDPERRDALARMLADAGHVVMRDDEGADARLLDLSMSAEPPRRTGAAPLLVLTDQPDRAADAAIPGVIRRLAGVGQVDAALRAVAAGLRVREPSPSRPLGFAATGGDEVPSDPLTPREMEILAAVGEGLSNKAVARALGISAHTVKFHLEAIFGKLDAGSRADAVAKGLRRGLIEL